MKPRSLPLVLAIFALQASAGNLVISNVPLGTGSGVSVKPNMLFILDDSGSMGWEYTPDWVNDPICQSNMASFGSTYSCDLGDVLYNWSGFNAQYYNPAIRYYPPKNADGSEWANASTSQSSPYTKVNPFNSTSTKNILTTYREVYWCKFDTDVPPSSNCKQNDAAALAAMTAGYPYPDGTYKYRKTKDNGAPYYYVATSGALSWCSDKALTSCQASRTSTYQYPKVSATAAVPATRATASLTFTEAGRCSKTYYITAISVDGISLLPGNIAVTGCDSAANREKAASDVAAAINSGTATHGFSATAVTNSVTITAPIAGFYAAPKNTNTYWNGKSISYSDNSSYIDVSLTNFAGGQEASAGGDGVKFERIDIVSSDNSYTKYADRSDCAGATCTYQEELQNFANWYSYYRTRMQMMKTAVSRAFASVSDTAPGAGFRIGFDVISNSSSNLTLNISEFTPAHKTNFYTQLFAATPSGYTPLRGALSKAGRLFAGRLSSDPVQYSCQQNFTFLTTDGYWNTNAETSSYGPYKEDGSTSVGNQDGTSAVNPPYRDDYNKSNTLADVAMYYYNHDLRPDMTDDVPTSAKDDKSYQHMVTFTMGLGMDGLIKYASNYETGGSTDYNAIVQGTKSWPDPITYSNEERVDDLWHAAVNGRGKYFAASSAQTVADSLNEALSGVSAMTGSSAAAATSNLEPVAGDNYAYVASYVTQTWEGNLEAKEINLTTGELSSASIWDARSLLDAKAAEASIPSGASGPGSRKLYTFDSSLGTTDKKMLLTWANVSAKGWTSYFDPAQLNQCSPITFCPTATNQNLFEFLMGKTDTTGTYRERIHVLGDIVNSQPVYVKKPSFGYADSGYDSYKNTSRDAMVYVGANDGFLHAFNADTGVERWAYLPSFVLPQLYELANSNYTHRYYTDGVISVGDVYTGSAWKTILVGGMAYGGKGYYALDVTDPANPLALWEFTDARMGYTYGNPIITKLPSGVTSSGGADIGGKWVVMVTSGYNNDTSLGSHDGQGILYVLDAYTGTEYFRLYTCTNQSSEATCAGSSGNPVGLAKVNNWVDDPNQDNTTKYVYGGDLAGNLWRFDIANKSVFKVAEIGEPITVKPELAEVSNKRVIYFGTGLFLQASDKSDRSRRSIYAIKDDPTATAPLTSVKTSGALVEQELVLASSTTRTMNAINPVDWNTQSGCFVELLEDGERVNVDPKIQLGTLVVASNVPDEGAASSCSTGGHSWLNFLDVRNCAYVANSQSNPDNVASVKLGSALAVGINIVKLPNGKLITITTTSDNQHPVKETPVGASGLPLKRVSWRELLTD